MNSKNSKTSDPHGISLNLTDKINLQRKDKYIALLKLSIYYLCKKRKKSYKNNRFKIELQHGIKNLSYLLDNILYQIFKITLNRCLKNMDKRLIILQ